MGLEELLEERFERLAAAALGLSPSEIRPVGAVEGSVSPVGSLVDYLGRFEASVAAALLVRRGLRAGEDYAILPEGPGERFVLVLRKDVGAEVLDAIDKLREVSYAKPAALRILKEWRRAYGEVEGDVDEAIHLALRVSRVRERLLRRGCPKCGGSAAKLFERVSSDCFELIVERTCCGYVERAEVPLKHYVPARGSS
ncbi:MAG: hypothetical protein QXT74_05605 [Candidatus Nezhaarchaeales archaeon]